MSRVLTVAASFGIMLCLGSVYAWSLFVPELQLVYRFTAAQAQLVFGMLIAVYPATMIIAGRVEKRMGSRGLALLSSLFFLTGYLVAGFSGGHFYLVLLGIGGLAGIGTGFGYMASLTAPVKCYPSRKGLMTGIAAAGFGLGAVILPCLTAFQGNSTKGALSMFTFIGLAYGTIIFLLTLIMSPPRTMATTMPPAKGHFFTHARFWRLFSAIFLGTFAGLMVIGSLKPIGDLYNIEKEALIIAVSTFAIANFLGRLFWGIISDYINTTGCVVAALTFQALAIFAMGFFTFSALGFMLIAAAIGFGFGSNFVLFARITAIEYGIDKLGIIYPFVFMGYAIAGIAGPISGGLLFDLTGQFRHALLTASLMSLIGALIFVFKLRSFDRKTLTLQHENQ